MWLLRIIITVWCWESSIAARILGIFPVPSISHQVVFRALTHELAQRGHELVVLTTDPAGLHPNITEIDAHDISYKMWNTEIISKIMQDESSGQISILNLYRLFQPFMMRLTEAQLSLPQVQELMQNGTDNFDLILVEGIWRFNYAFKHKFKAPLIAVNSLSGAIYNYDAMGAPSHPILYPDFMSPRIAHTTLLEKIDALYFHVSRYYIEWSYMEQFNELTRKYFGADTPDLTVLESQTDMMFLNVNPIWDGVRPTPPNVIYMWGTHLKPPKELPMDLKNFLDNSTHGVVYMSLGSNAKSAELPEDRVRTLLEAFRRLPYDVLWKWEAEELPGRPENVRISKWLPQADLLRHPKVKVFITQGGLQSTDEALFAGVPLVGIPIFGDQESNVAKFVKHGVGVKLDLKTLTAEQLEDAINTVLKTDKYRAAVRRMSRLLADGVDGGPGVTRAARWAEYVIRHGGASHLRCPAAGVSYSEYFMLDVVAVVVLAAVCLLLTLILTLRFVYSNLKLLTPMYKYDVKIHKD